MSSLTFGPLSSTVVSQITTTLVPTVTKIDARDDTSSLSIVIAFSIVFVLAPVTISGNTMILAAFYRYKRLRTASNCLLASLALSDLGVGVFMPFGIHLELSGIPESGISSISIVPYCIVIALCSVSVLISVAIAVDRLTSLAQPLRYKNIITHSSVERYIAVFWIYSIAVGLSPLVYSQILGFAQLNNSESCRFGAAIQPPVRVFLVIAVWAPSALVLLGCYIYVYLVARAHARAIYTVELSFRHQTQTLALPRYGQTLAVTVGAFLILWLPFQACMLLDILCGTKILSDWSVVWLGLPILAHSGVNPWIYAFHHGEMRVAAGKIAEDIITLFGIHPSRYGCSPVGRGGSNLELAEVNNKSNNEEHRPPVEDCFAAKYHNNYYSRERRPEITSHDTDISPESNDVDQRMSHCSEFAADIVEENVDDLTKMLGPDYAYNRCHIIDTNHNVDKIKNLKYLLDPAFNKIRHLRRINHKSAINSERKNFPQHFNEPKFISYQNLKTDFNSRKTLKLNALSDPMLNGKAISYNESSDIGEALHNEASHICQCRDSGLASMSDPNIKEINVTKSRNHRGSGNCHGHSVLSLDHTQCLPLSRKQDRRIYREISTSRTRGEIAARWKQASKRLTVTANRLSSLFHLDAHRPSNFRYSGANIAQSSGARVIPTSVDSLRHSESISGLERTSCSRFLEPARLMDSLVVPTIRSEPPSPIDPCPLDSLREEDSMEELAEMRHSLTRRSSTRSPVRHSDPIPYVLLNIEDFDYEINTNKKHPIDPEELSKALDHHTYEKPIEALTLSQNSFPEHNSTRFNSRRPSDLRWSEASRSQEILSNVNEKHQKSPSSYSVNNFQGCNSNSDFNDVTCLDSFMCPDALTSSLRESFFETPSIQNSDVFTSFDEPDIINETSIDPRHLILPTVHSSSVSSVNFKSPNEQILNINQSKSTESLMIRCRHAILRVQSVKHRDQLRIGLHERNAVLKESKGKSRRAPLAISTPIDISTPTFEPTVDMKGTPGIGVRV